MKRIYILLFFLTVSLILLPSITKAETSGTQTSEIIHVDINGLVCDFCARALEKVFSTEDSVGSISVDLDSKVLTVNLKEGQTIHDDRLTELVQDSGYNIESIRRSSP